ncbi:MAG: hypothetical protein ACHQF2_05905 [Flavobacteriales bacterium]
MIKKPLFLFLFFSTFTATAQIQDRTQIRGFIDINTGYDFDNEKLQFSLGEQDLFITSDLTDKISFLGESVFKFSSTSSTKFAISLERAIFKFNYWGNHSFFAGKVHTALNYWNDTYHHGRLFFPTVGRPELFNQNIIPLHTTGIGFSGENLSAIKFGYTLMVGNGIGSTDISDDNFAKAVIAACHIKPIDGLRIGLSAYFDKIVGNVHDHGGGVVHVHDEITQTIYSGSIAYFKNNIEILTEGSMCTNSTDSLKNKVTNAAYFYAGYRIKNIIVPYFRFDYLDFDTGEMFFAPNKTNAYAVGIRYEMSYLTSFKLEYQYKKVGNPDFTNNIFLQVAIGF